VGSALRVRASVNPTTVPAAWTLQSVPKAGGAAAAFAPAACARAPPAAPLQLAVTTSDAASGTQPSQHRTAINWAAFCLDPAHPLWAAAPPGEAVIDDAAAWSFDALAGTVAGPTRARRRRRGAAAALSPSQGVDGLPYPVRRVLPALLRRASGVRAVCMCVSEGRGGRGDRGCEGREPQHRCPAAPACTSPAQACSCQVGGRASHGVPRVSASGSPSSSSSGARPCVYSGVGLWL
jgi:hypothetical protein